MDLQKQLKHVPLTNAISKQVRVLCEAKHPKQAKQSQLTNAITQRPYLEL